MWNVSDGVEPNIFLSTNQVGVGKGVKVVWKYVCIICDLICDCVEQPNKTQFIIAEQVTRKQKMAT